MSIQSENEDREWEQRVRQNLDDYWNDVMPSAADQQPLEPRTVELEMLLASIDDVPSQDVKGQLGPMSPERRAIIAKGLQSVERAKQANKLDYYPKLRQQAREAYADQRAAKGHAVRPYQRHAKVDGETTYERSRRIHREAARKRAGKDEHTVRGYQDLTGLTNEERMARQRLQNAESKRRQRAASKANEAKEATE
jgi:hypothetical protein